jgi:hypothetical protein
LLVFPGLLYVAYIAAESVVLKVKRWWDRREREPLFVPTAEELAAWHAGEERDYSHLGWVRKDA